MNEAEARALAAKREAHKSPGLGGKRWEAKHDSVKGWHVALVDDPKQASFAAHMKARDAFRRGDPAFLDLAAEALIARVKASLK